MSKQCKTSKRGVSLKILIIIELLICYMSILTVISYWRGPVQYRALPEEPLLISTDFASFSDDKVVGAQSLRLQNDFAGNAVGYASLLNLIDLEQIAVSFSVDCPVQYAGNTLHIDLWNVGYDRDEQEYTVALQGGLNQFDIFLNKGLEAPNEAMLRFFTLDLADYSIENIQVSLAETLPKVSSVLLTVTVVSVLILLFTIFALFNSRNNEMKNVDFWLAISDSQNYGEYEEVVMVKGVMRKIAHRLIGWYVDPLYQQNAYLKEKLEENKLALSAYQQNLKNEKEYFDNCSVSINEQKEKLDDCLNQIKRHNEQLNCIQQGVVDLQVDKVSQQEFRERLQDKTDNEIEQAVLVSDYINSNQAAIIYAYRYLLDREPEDIQLILDNKRDWYQLKHDITLSAEYQDKHKSSGSNYIGDAYSVNKKIEQNINNGGSVPDYATILEKNYKKIIKPGDTVIDVGAHIGRHTKIFKQIIGESGFLYAFEPLKQQYDILRSALAAPNVAIINKTLSDKQGKMDFFVVTNYPAESGLRKKQYIMEDAMVEKTIVDVDTLDNYLDDMQSVNYINIDAEGAEIAILNGASKLLTKHRPIISVEYYYLSYEAYGLTKRSLWDFAFAHKYYITDIFGNVIFDVGIWHSICDSNCWDYFLVPYEKIQDFLIEIHFGD